MISVPLVTARQNGKKRWTAMMVSAGWMTTTARADNEPD